MLAVANACASDDLSFCQCCRHENTKSLPPLAPAGLPDSPRRVETLTWELPNEGPNIPFCPKTGIPNVYVGLVFVQSIRDPHGLTYPELCLPTTMLPTNRQGSPARPSHQIRTQAAFGWQRGSGRSAVALSAAQNMEEACPQNKRGTSNGA